DRRHRACTRVQPRAARGSHHWRPICRPDRRNALASSSSPSLPPNLLGSPMRSTLLVLSLVLAAPSQAAQTKPKVQKAAASREQMCRALVGKKGADAALSARPPRGDVSFDPSFALGPLKFSVGGAQKARP